MTNPTKETRLDECQKLIDEQRGSGLTIKAFCNQKNITVSKWNYCRLVLKRAKILSSKLSPVKVINKETLENSNIKLALPNGFQLALPQDLEVVRLKQLVEVLLSC